ncbi:MAG: hypothetical protein V6Z81_10915 [Parvularculales bacterium]
MPIESFYDKGPLKYQYADHNNGADMKTVLIIGSGVLARMVVLQLSWRGSVGRMVIAARNSNAAKSIANLTRISCRNHASPEIGIVEMDLDRESRTTEVLSRLKPDIVFNTATLQAYWTFGELPAPINKAIALAGVGPWTSMHLLPVYKLMRAVHASQLNTTVINSAFPDAVNPILAEIGLAPTIGIGNLANIVPAFELAAAHQLNVESRSITASLVAHHAVSNSIPRFGSSRGTPFIIRFYHDGESDVTDDVDIETACDDIKNRFARPRGKEGMWVTSSSAVSIIEALLGKDTGQVLHAPGLKGLVGGYPVRLVDGAFKLALPTGIDPAEAVRVNRKGQTFDGIDSISSDGFLDYTDQAKDIVEAVTGIKLTPLYFSDLEAYARALFRQYREFHEKWSS